MAAPAGRARVGAHLQIRSGVGRRPHLGEIPLRNTGCGIPDPKGSSCFSAFSQWRHEMSRVNGVIFVVLYAAYIAASVLR